MVVARGRRYFSNDLVVTRLRDEATAAADIPLGETPAARVYVLDAKSLEIVAGAAGR